MWRSVKCFRSWGLVFALVLFILPDALVSQTVEKGNLVGFVYSNDGATPIEGAVIMVKNVTTGTVYESSQSDHLGIFRFQAIGTGIYALGVSTGQGDFNSQDFIGVTDGRTSKVTIALDPYAGQAIEAARAVAQEQKEAGESLVGKVIRYIPASKQAEVFIERGLIQAGDRLHFKGPLDEGTNFFQDARRMKLEGESVRRILTSQSGMLPVSRVCRPGDLVFVVCKKGIPPFFLAPLGIASVVTGSASLVTVEEEDSSPFRIKK